MSVNKLNQVENVSLNNMQRYVTKYELLFSFY